MKRYLKPGWGRRRQQEKTPGYYENSGNFTESEKKLLSFIRGHFGLPKDYKLVRNVPLSELGKGTHSLIRFSFELERKFDLEFTDEEGGKVEKGCNLQTLFKLLRAHKKLMNLIFQEG